MAKQFAFKRGKGMILKPVDQQWLLRTYFCLRDQNEYMNDVDDARIIKIIVEKSGCSEDTIIALINGKAIEEKYARKGTPKPKKS